MLAFTLPLLPATTMLILATTHRLPLNAQSQLVLRPLATNVLTSRTTASVQVGVTSSDVNLFLKFAYHLLDIFAPGMNIVSTWIGSNYATNTISGTSMASPHVAGLLAYFLSFQPKSDSGFYTKLEPAALKKNIIAIGSQDCLSDIPGKTPNVLIYNGGGSGNLTEIFDGKPYVHDADLKKTSQGTSDYVSEAESYLKKVETEVMNDVKIAFEKAKVALEHSAL
jgi:cerevisin